MPTSVEAQGLTVDEAIQTALNQLGASRDRVEIKILHHPRGGFLGIGARRAKVRATLRKDAFRDGQEFDMAPRRRPVRRRRNRAGKGRREESKNGDRQRRGGTEAGQRAGQGTGQGADQGAGQGAGKTDGEERRVRGRGQEPGRDGRDARNAGAGEGNAKRGRRRRGGRGRGARSSAGAKTDKPAAAGDKPAAEPGSGSSELTGAHAAAGVVAECAPEREARVSERGGEDTVSDKPTEVLVRSAAEMEQLRDQAGKLTAGLIGKMGFEATVEVGMSDRDDTQVVINVTSEAEGILIGRRGQTLDALEHILNRMIFAGETAGGATVVLDIGGYRERRWQSLHDTATRLRDRALIEQRAVQISPMSMRDRRIIQDLLEDDRTVVLKVLGSGLYRRIQITPAGIDENRESVGDQTEEERERQNGGPNDGRES